MTSGHSNRRTWGLPCNWSLAAVSSEWPRTDGGMSGRMNTLQMPRSPACQAVNEDSISAACSMNPR